VTFPVDQATSIDPFDVTNVFVNYTIKNTSWMRGSKLGFSVNNLLDSHNIVGITRAVPATIHGVYVYTLTTRSIFCRAQHHGDTRRRLRASPLAKRGSNLQDYAAD